MTNKDKFYNLANEITSNPEAYVRKLSDEDIEAYENGDDDFGDIVLWAERQLQSAKHPSLIDETEEEWFGYELEVLESLVDTYKKEKENV